MTSGQPTTDPMGQDKELDRALVDIQLLEVEHVGLRLHSFPVSSRSTVSIAPTMSFPFPSAATLTGTITSTTRIPLCCTKSASSYPT